MSQRYRRPAGALMTPAQKQMFWREWAKAVAWQKWDRIQAETERKAMLTRCGFSSLTHVDRMGGFDRLLAHVRFLQDNLKGAREMDHPEDGDRRRLLWVIREELLPGLALYVEDPEAYMLGIIRDKFPWRLAVPAEGEEPKAYPAILDELEARPQLRQRGTVVESVPSELDQLRMTLTQRLSDLKRKGKKVVVREVKPANCETAQVEDLEPALAGEGEPF